MLIVLSGLPGTGKTTIAREVARAVGGVHLRIDSIEQALREAGVPVEGEGYAIARAVAADNLALGRTVIADCVNPWRLTRDMWREVARGMGSDVLDVEVVCSDPAEHRRRVETRVSDLAGRRLPSWQEVLDRDYHPWDGDRLVVDTARAGVEACVQTIVARISR